MFLGSLNLAIGLTLLILGPALYPSGLARGHEELAILKIGLATLVSGLAILRWQRWAPTATLVAAGLSIGWILLFDAALFSAGGRMSQVGILQQGAVIGYWSLLVIFVRGPALRTANC